MLVIVYEDALAPMRNLTLFDGLAMITGSGNNNVVDVPISGFLTPPLGPVDLQLGVVAFDGDRGEDGDQLGFNGTGAVEYISDATHELNNAFNSTHSTNGTMNPWRQPAFNNTLGHDANVFIPDNSNFEFLPNNATDASIRVAAILSKFPSCFLYLIMLKDRESGRAREKKKKHRLGSNS